MQNERVLVYRFQPQRNRTAHAALRFLFFEQRVTCGDDDLVDLVQKFGGSSVMLSLLILGAIYVVSNSNSA